ncbi:MAG TPA: Maf family protein [Planctomycetaceae bacterium]|nr:Maf family protein [Planctomycetaceae bacterium]
MPDRIEPRIVLASRSPRRRELLELLVSPASIRVCPPRDAEEAGFEGLHDLPTIEARSLEIARAKADDVRSQLAGEATSGEDLLSVVVAADTEVVVTDAVGRLHVLGQPPEDDTWKGVVRRWFREYYAGRSHLALTGLSVSVGGRRVERLVRTEVTFREDVDGRLDWYISTGEPRGKAGGYAIQGAGSLFVTQVKGSLSNVVGLPLEALVEIFEELGIHTAGSV